MSWFVSSSAWSKSVETSISDQSLKVQSLLFRVRIAWNKMHRLNWLRCASLQSLWLHSIMTIVSRAPSWNQLLSFSGYFYKKKNPMLLYLSHASLLLLQSLVSVRPSHSAESANACSNGLSDQAEKVSYIKCIKSPKKISHWLSLSFELIRTRQAFRCGVRKAEID